MPGHCGHCDRGMHLRNVYVLSLDDGGANSREKIEQLSLTEDGQTCVHAPQEAERFLAAETFVLVKWPFQQGRFGQEIKQ